MVKVVEIREPDPKQYYLFLLAKLDEQWDKMTEEEQESIESKVRGREIVVDDMVAAIEVLGANGRQRFALEPCVSVHKIVVFPHVPGDVE